MKMKRALAALLCISLLMLPVTGCDSSDEYFYENGTDSPSENTPPFNFGDVDCCDPLGEAERILQLLNSRIGSDNFVEFFREMMFEHSEDPGSISSPDGYLFREGDMVSEFFEATIGLEIGEISGIVETMYGYHIILRIPIDYDSVPIALMGGGNFASLRMLAAIEDFWTQHSQWIDAVMAEVEFSPEYEALDLAAVFGEEPDAEESFSSLASDTVMISSGDLSITWAHLYVFLFHIVEDIFQRHEDNNIEVEWHEKASEDYTLAEMILEYATDEAISLFSYLYGMQVNNIVLSDEDLQRLDDSIDDIIEEFNSKELFEQFLLEESNYNNFENFVDFHTIEFSISVLVDTLYGEDGAGFPDELVRQYAETYGFLMAMHILRMKHDH
jgi:hypothetical protein